MDRIRCNDVIVVDSGRKKCCEEKFKIVTSRWQTLVLEKLSIEHVEAVLA